MVSTMKAPRLSTQTIKFLLLLIHNMEIPLLIWSAISVINDAHNEIAHGDDLHNTGFPMDDLQKRVPNTFGHLVIFAESSH